MIKLKKTYAKPMRPWEKQRILEEQKLIQNYGFKNKREIWKIKAKIARIRKQAKSLVSIRTKQQERQKNQLLISLYNYGLISKGATIEDVLGLRINDLCERRLQTILIKKRLANTPKQARQLTAHGHAFIGDKKVSSPSRLVKLTEEQLVKVVGVDIEESKSKSIKKTKKAEELKEEIGELEDKEVE